jgi:ABC-type transport system involved in multi-copper enzyme maturation permease subunit
VITLNLWRAEWLKARKRLLNRLILGIIPAILAVVFVAVTGAGYFYPDSEFAEATEILPFPTSLDVGVELLGQLGLLLVVVFVANSVGGEYGRDTWKAILPRYGNRLAFLLTKWVVGLVALLVLVAATVASAVVFGWFGALTLGMPAEPSSASETAESFRQLGVTLLEFIFLGTLTLFGAVVTRSTLGATITGILTPIILQLVGPFLGRIVEGAPIISPMEHLDNLRARVSEFTPEEAAYFTQLFDRSVSPLASVLVVLGYIALLLGGSLYLFAQRDIAGE